MSGRRSRGGKGCTITRFLRPVAARIEAVLDHVFWIGGGSGAGKSTVAHHLGAQYGLPVYATDDVMAQHARRSTAETCPRLHAFMAMDMDERWVRRSPEAMFETFPWFHGEGFDMVLDDLRAGRWNRGAIAEGFRLLPDLVARVAAPRHAVWLLPTPEFRRAVFDERGPAWGFFGDTSDPGRARANLLARDAMFTDRVREDARRLGLPVIDVDGSMPEDQVVDAVSRIFGR
jgi:2-phosphoglycerate kinase